MSYLLLLPVPLSVPLPLPFSLPVQSFVSNFTPPTYFPNAHISPRRRPSKPYHDPPQSSLPKFRRAQNALRGVIVVLPAASGWSSPPDRVLAARYAHRGNFEGLLPDIIDGVYSTPQYSAT